MVGTGDSVPTDVDGTRRCMYSIDVHIQGTTPLLQHKFAPAVLTTLMEGASKRTGAPDYSLEWLDTMYVTSDGYLCQPATHLEGAPGMAALPCSDLLRMANMRAPASAPRLVMGGATVK